MNREQIINAIATRDVESLRAATTGREKTIMLDADGCYVGTKVKAKESELKGKTVIRFVNPQNN